MRGPISVPSGGEEALRRALLQRVADRLAFARAIADGADPNALHPAESWRCCWVAFEWPTPPSYLYPMHRFVHRICDEGCPHWHHEIEVLLA